MKISTFCPETGYENITEFFDDAPEEEIEDYLEEQVEDFIIDDNEID